MKTNMVCFSPDAKFFCCAPWTADVRIWEIICSKDGKFEKVARVMELKGHKAAVKCVSFSPDSSTCVTTSKDGTWKLWNINVNYKRGGEPQCLLTIQSPVSDPFEFVQFSPDGKILAFTIKNILYFYSPEGKLLYQIPDAHKTQILSLRWATHSSSLLLTSDGSTLRFWKSPQ